MELPPLLPRLLVLHSSLGPKTRLQRLHSQHAMAFTRAGRNPSKNVVADSDAEFSFFAVGRHLLTRQRTVLIEICELQHSALVQRQPL